MKVLLLLALYCPLLLPAQNKTHHFANDTLYTSSGFKIYPGQTLQFGKRASDYGFRFISQLTIQLSSFENNSVEVTELSGYGYSPTGSANIDVKGRMVFRDGSKGLVSFTLAFDLAIGKRLPGTSSELILPKEFLITTQQAMAMHLPALENDTLYTSCGFKIYKGQFLQFGETTGNFDRFRYVNIENAVSHHSLRNNYMLVKEIKNLSFSVLDNAYIDIKGILVLKNKRTAEVLIHLAFDHAIENIAGIPSELIVPAEFKGVLKYDGEKELARLETLYKIAVITKEELEAAEQKLKQQ